MNFGADPFLAEAAGLLGPRGLTCDPQLMEPWLTDWRGRYTGAARGLASPGSTLELGALVKIWPPAQPKRAASAAAASARSRRLCSGSRVLREDHLGWLRALFNSAGNLAAGHGALPLCI